MTWRLDSRSPEETSQFANQLASLMRSGDCLVLSGDLGAGKTWFTTALLTRLQVIEAVHSPTFNLVNVYHAVGGLLIYHADFYRLDSVLELWAAGWEDYLDGAGLLLIEWGERFPEALPEDYLHVNLQTTGANSRRFCIEAHGLRSLEIKEGWADALGGH
jgi:tRNA threonylcarbamoyladenosine biosynthesis protein TsaE